MIIIIEIMTIKKLKHINIYIYYKFILLKSNSGFINVTAYKSCVRE